MRIALTSYEYPPFRWSGIGNYTRQAARLLRNCGHEVTVFGGTPGASHESDFEGIRVQYIRCSERCFFAAALVEPFMALHRFDPFDVVEFPDLEAEGSELLKIAPEIPSVVRLHTPSFVAAWVDRSTFGRPAVLLQSLRIFLSEVIRLNRPRMTTTFLAEHWSLASSYDYKSDPEYDFVSKADLVVSPSRRLAGQVSEIWNIPPERIQVVSNPFMIDHCWINSADPGDTIRTITYFGGIKAFKGVDVLGRIIPRIIAEYPDIRFVFAGSSQGSPVRNLTIGAFVRGEVCQWIDMEDWLKSQLAPWRKSIEFSGQLDRDGIGELISRSDLCVFPSRFDNFPNACLEAMAAGRPVVATRSGGMEEMIEDGYSGLLVEPGSATCLHRAIRWMIEHPEGRIKMADRGREGVRRFSDQQLGPKYEAYFNEAIGRASLRNSTKTQDSQVAVA